MNGSLPDRRYRHEVFGTEHKELVRGAIERRHDVEDEIGVPADLGHPPEGAPVAESAYEMPDGLIVVFARDEARSLGRTDDSDSLAPADRKSTRLNSSH